MLLSSFYFWERSTNCFHTPFGMITPTLLDVAAIAGLWPMGDDYHSTAAPTAPIAISTENVAFGRFVKHHYVEEGEVSDAEHVAFLLYWLSTYVFCTKSLRIPAKLLPLANLLHEGRKLALARLVLGNLYQMINEAMADIRNPKIISLNVVGPLWLLQLWLNAVFESFLPAKKTFPVISNTRIDAHRLETLTPPYDASDFEADFKKYFSMFLELKHYRSSFAPYSKPTYGPRWLRYSYPNLPDPGALSQHQLELWQTILSPRVLTIGFASNDHTLCGYNPQLVSRQFGLSQDMANTLFDSTLVLYLGVVTKTSVFNKTVHYYNKKLLDLSPFPFVPSYYVTKSFKTWWSGYWTEISMHLVDCVQCMTNAFLLQNQIPKKTKAEPIPRSTPQTSYQVPPVTIEVDDDDDDDDVSLADKLNLTKGRKRGATPTTSASKKRAKGVRGSTVSKPYPSKSTSQPQVGGGGDGSAVDKVEMQEHSASSPPPHEELLVSANVEASSKHGEKTPIEKAPKKKKSRTKSGRGSGSKSSQHSKSSADSSPLKQFARKVTFGWS
ncbi:uncharacterized protein LOC130719219 [Lotus japonicus]|uniref:uncharacterized protein LOC130719219 n=1 Tax=Lotus japonicus TaxID=34305 RepID=UPI0025910DF1|nr:uncharacterized protein LOC130719219 [Lotus japonicus]